MLRFLNLIGPPQDKRIPVVCRVGKLSSRSSPTTLVGEKITPSWEGDTARSDTIRTSAILKDDGRCGLV